ncbi:MAG: site-2 protease family protein [Candidatus Altimarinota bacterium]
MAILSFILSFIVFVLLFSALILIHELGHFLAARKSGIKVEEFGLGMPPKVWGFKPKNSNTEYTLNAIPFGGFVRLYGEDNFDKKATQSKESYVGKPAWVKILVVIAGVVMNFLLAWVLLTGGYIVGMQPMYLNQEDIFNGLKEGMIVTEEGLLIKEVGVELQEQGISKGDKIVSINDVPIQSANEFLNVEDGETFKAEVLKDGQIISFQSVKTSDNSELEVYDLMYVPQIFYSEKGLSGFTDDGARVVSVNGLKVYDFEEFAKMLNDGSEAELILDNGNEVLLKGDLQKGDTLKIVEVLKNSPAEQAGLKSGDTLVEINGVAVSDYAKLAEILADPKDKVVYSIIEEGQQKDFELIPGEDGLVGVLLSQYWLSADGNGQFYARSIPSSLIEVKDLQLPWYQAPIKSIEEMWRLSILTVEMFGNVLRSVFTQFYVPEGVAGPVGIAVMTNTFVQEGLMPVIRFAALLSLSLGVINLLPFPGLDGGRLFLILIPLIIRRKLDPKLEGVIHTIGFLVLMLLILAVTFNDLVKLISPLF